MESHRSYQGSDWFCLCRDAKMGRHRRKRCSRCHGNKTSAGVSRALKSLDPLYSQMVSANDQPAEMKADQSGASWENSFPTTDDKEEEDEPQNGDGGEDQESPKVKRRREEELQPLPGPSSLPVSPIISPVSPTSSAPPRPSPPPELSVCAKNISLTASGEKVILWTREADRVILTMCQQEGANQQTFQTISNLLGNKTPDEVSLRFRDLMRLFRTAARHATVDDEAPPPEPTADKTPD